MVMKFKKIASLFTAFVLILSLFSVGVSAQEVGTVILYESDYRECDSSMISLLAEVEEIDYAQLRADIFKGIRVCENEIDISKYGILLENRGIIGNLVWNEMPEAFHIEGLSVSYIVSTGEIASIIVSYRCNAEEYGVMYSEFENSALEMTKDLKTDRLSDVQKALLLHDRLAIKCEYDESVFSDTETYKTYTAYGALVEGIAVCQGYAEAYDYLLEKVGIYSVLCSSEKLNHAWNIVRISGKYYHVDVTWDDPLFENREDKPQGFISHENFLRSSEGFYNNGNNSHIADDYNTAPWDTTFDSYFWYGLHKEFYLIGKDIYYTNNYGDICGYDEQGPLINAGLGDINGDRKINAMDISFCRGFITDNSAPNNLQVKACDINKDGKLNISDLVHFKRLLLTV